MGKLHELLATEETAVSAAEKLLGETNEKFHKYNEFFTGSVRVLARLKESPEDKALEKSARRDKELPTDVQDTLGYVLPFVTKALNVKLRKHLTNQVAKADIEYPAGTVLMREVPVDFLLDLEKALPRWRAIFDRMPVLDPSKQWVPERKGVWKTREPVATAQTEKRMFPVVLAEATKEHPAQVKESTRDEVVGTFFDTLISGAATSQQKADLLALVDGLIIAVKQARMRANSVEIVKEVDGADKITNLIKEVFDK